jgi:predicted GNAT family acetyltransferase
MAIDVRNDEKLNRYELLVDGVHAGVSEYRIRDGVLTFVHTEIEPALEGKGLGSELAKGALNLVRADTDYRVASTCPFMSAYLEGHPEHQDLLER